MNNSVITVIGKDRVVSYRRFPHSRRKPNQHPQYQPAANGRLLHHDYLGGYLEMPKSRQEMLDLFAEESKKLALDIRMQNEEIFQAMHRI